MQACVRRKKRQTPQRPRSMLPTFRRAIASKINLYGPFFGKTHPLA